MKHYKLKYIDVAYFIYGTDEEKPTDESMKYKRHSEGLSWHDHLMNEWLESFKEICPVREEDEEAFRELSQYNYLNNVYMLHDSWFKDIEKGIDIPTDRVFIDNYGYRDGGKPNRLAIMINPEAKLSETELKELKNKSRKSVRRIRLFLDTCVYRRYTSYKKEKAFKLLNETMGSLFDY
jgi:hypothetical protein